ncbi:hypothetical protein SAMN04487944_10746 [Gracilibacillus ureilyticus]|uniref:Uncharacterized protein n=1 Tax=Gracilibacillus ureilyticus TaxID=531814 RepID=A0A1H9QP22_9BACI|nr:hypothetical protein SAMN04487944_10746 [Gracilibacillus ureilyticus]
MRRFLYQEASYYNLENNTDNHPPLSSNILSTYFYVKIAIDKLKELESANNGKNSGC